MVAGAVGAEAAEHDALQTCRGVQPGGHGTDGNTRGAVGRESVDAGRNGRKRNRPDPMGGGEFERNAVARGQQPVAFLRAAFAPHRPDRMDDVARRQAVSPGDLGVTSVATAQRAALRKQFRPGGAVNRAVDASAAEERAVGGVDDGIDLERRDVGDRDVELRAAMAR